MKKQIRQLKEIISQEQSRIVDFLVKNEMEKVENSLKRISVAEKQIAENLKKKRQLISICLIALIVVSVSLIYHIKIPESNVSVQTIHTGFIAHTKNTWNSNRMLECKRIRMNHVGKAHVFPAIRQFDNPGEVNVVGKRIILNKISISPSAWIEFDLYSQKGLLMYIRNGFIDCELQLDSGLYTLDNIPYPVDVKKDVLNTVIHLVTDTVKNNTEPIVISFLGISDFKIDLSEADTIYFAKPVDRYAGTYNSSIVSGEIFFEETTKSKELGNFFKLELVSDSIVQFTTVDNELGLESHFQGEVKKAIKKTKNKDENLKPSLLEYFNHNSPLAMIWSAIIFLIGLVWSIKNSLFKK